MKFRNKNATPLASLQLLAEIHPDEFALKDLFRTNIHIEQLSEVYAYFPLPTQSRLDLEQILREGSATQIDHARVGDALLMSSLRRTDSHLDKSGDFLGLFCCASMVQIGARDPLVFAGESDILAKFTMHSLHLGREVVTHSASMLAWRYLTNPGINDTPLYLALAILLLAISGNGLSGHMIGSLADWVLSHQTCEEDRPLFAFAAPEWRDLASRVIGNPFQSYPMKVTGQLATIYRLVVARTE